MERSPEIPKLERRRIPGTAVATSLLGIALDSGSIASPSEPQGLAASLRLARRYGVTTFGLRVGGPLPWMERAVAEAFPVRDPDLVFILSRTERGMSELPRHPGEFPGSPSEVTRDFERAFRDVAQRLGQHGSVLADLDTGGTYPGAALEVRKLLERYQQDGLIAGWSWRWPAEAPGDSGPPSEMHPVISAKLSLLEPQAVGPLDSRASQGPLGVLVHDPFAHGLLDGTRLEATLGERGPRSAPPNLRSLHAELDPVLRLEFLTRTRRRTLAQGALQFLFRWTWVSTVLVPLPRPERWAEIVGAVRTPPLDVAELEALGISPEGRGSKQARGERSG
jgi:hypothetical protein